MVRVVLENLEKVYPNGVRAITDFSLAVESGEMVALVGPSGCGKTTLLRIIAGLEGVTRGTITLGDRVVNHAAPKDRNVAMVFQNAALYPHLDAYDNLAFSLRLRRVPRKAIRQRVLEAAALVGIEHLLDRRARELSGGEAQRVALGRAVVRRPDCFLFDEPLSSLDAPLRAQMRGELKRFHQRLGITALYVTHDQEEALTLGRRIVVLRGGRIQQIGEPLEVYCRPVNGFVAGFIGSPRMNFLAGTLVPGAEGLGFEAGPVRLPVPGWAAARLAGRAGQSVFLGVRPEAISARPLPDDSPGAVEGTIELVDPLGDRVDVTFCAIGQQRLVARLDAPCGLAPRTAAKFLLDAARLHYFAPDPGNPAAPGESLCPAP
jgi:multiple sugar transport system ATP-binding protein